MDATPIAPCHEVTRHGANDLSLLPSRAGLEAAKEGQRNCDS